MSQRTPHADDRCRQNASPPLRRFPLLSVKNISFQTSDAVLDPLFLGQLLPFQPILSTHTECRLGYGYHRFGDRLYGARMNFELPGVPAPLRPRQSHQLRPSSNSHVRQHQLLEHLPPNRRRTVILNIAAHNSYDHIRPPSAHLLS